MIEHQNSRRHFLGQSAKTIIGLIALPSLGTLAGMLIPSSAFAKPGGHLVLSHECLATFQFEKEYQKIFGVEPVQLYLGGSGYASFTNLQDYSVYDISQIFQKQTVMMEWEINQCYAGNMPSWGTVRAIGQVKKSSSSRSYIIFNAKQKDRLFPANATNILYFNLEFPNLKETVFNAEPIILNGEVRNISRQDIEEDYRYKKRPEGLAEVLKGDLSQMFEPVGTHNLVNPVKFFLKSDPKKHVATLIKSQLSTQIHYGIEIVLSDCKIKNNIVDATFRIINLSGERQRITWYVGDSYDLAIIKLYSSDIKISNTVTREGRITLEPARPVSLTVQAKNTNPKTKLGEKACLFCGAHNTPKDLNSFRTNFISGFTLAEGKDFRKITDAHK